jgi:hypothetical protein
LLQITGPNVVAIIGRRTTAAGIGIRFFTRDFLLAETAINKMLLGFISGNGIFK